MTSGGASAALTYAYGEPLLLLATPLAVVVMGAADGVARAMNRGLEERVYEWITGSGTPSKEKLTGSPPDDLPPGE